MSSKTKSTAAREDAKPALVPKLRFPEFRGVEAWDLTTIGALGSFYYGKSAPKWSLAEDATTPCVRYGELYTKFGPVITETFSRTNIDPKTLRFSKGGEILVPRVGEKPEDFGKCCSYLPLKDVAIGEMISVFETDQDPLFYTYYFRNLYKQFANVVEGQNVKNLYYVELEPLAIHRPSIAEQQKIAECLSSLDELMGAQARKVEALKEHKKGMMQQLFPGEGETQPRLRFPEFRDAGEWVLRKGSEITSKITKGSSPSWQGFSYQKKGVLFITSENVRDGFLDVSEPKFLPEEFFAKQRNSHLLYGDILINIVGASIGRNCVYGLEEPAFTNQAVALFRVIKDHSSEFVGYCYQQDRSQEAVSASQSDSARPNLSLADLRDMEFLIPSLSEQQRIAECLNSIDAMITAETQKIEALKTHNKGLMQQLFPSPAIQTISI